MNNIRYTQEHEWLRIEADGLITVGITDYAQNQLGDVVYVQLPDAGKTLTRGEEAVVIESVKAAGEISMPVDGEVVEANGALADEPAKVNEDPMGSGWFFRFRTSDMATINGLMDEASYADFVKSLG